MTTRWLDNFSNQKDHECLLHHISTAQYDFFCTYEVYRILADPGVGVKVVVVGVCWGIRPRALMLAKMP